MNWDRVVALRRFRRLSAWKLLAAIATDPRWQPMYDSVARSSPQARFEDPSPWFSWKANIAIEGEVASRRGQRVLEWGTGASTLWWERQGLEVTGIEHDSDWHAVCASYLPRADIRLVPRGETYWRPDVSVEDYKVFVIDGRDRVKCAEFVIEGIDSGKIRSGALVVFDDSNRERYRQSLLALGRRAQVCECFTGPTSFEIDKLTTLFWL